MSFPKIDGFVVTEKLGSGSYSTVYKAYTKVGARSVVAIKCIDKSRIRHSGSAIDNLITEIRLLKTLRHPHIVEMKDFIWDNKNIYIITEYCCGGDLSRYIKRYGRVAESRVRYFLQQLAAALRFLREKGVVHMDLKPHNLLLHKSSEGKYTLKVADFGFAQHMSDEARESSVKGSPLYMAPELVMGRGYDARVDLWSVGVIVYECLFGKAPYSSPTFKELIEKIQSHAPIQIPSNASISPGCRQLLTSLLQHDPAKRISYEDFFAHPYLDLEHMPSDENYEKAVSLLRFAIDYDTRGRYAEAFTAYRKALSYLVPILNVQHDQMKKAALTNKLYSYMQRAEELQSMLYGNKGQPPATLSKPVPIISLIGTARETSIDLTSCEQLVLPNCDVVGQTEQLETTEQLEPTEQLEQPEQLVDDVPNTSTSNDRVKGSNASGGGGGGRLEFARKLFRKKPASVTEPSEVKEDKERPNDDSNKKIPVGENVNDACRIT